MQTSHDKKHDINYLVSFAQSPPCLSHFFLSGFLLSHQLCFHLSHSSTDPMFLSHHHLVPLASTMTLPCGFLLRLFPPMSAVSNSLLFSLSWSWIILSLLSLLNKFLLPPPPPPGHTPSLFLSSLHHLVFQTHLLHPGGSILEIWPHISVYSCPLCLMAWKVSLSFCGALMVCLPL